jgi:uncharacterized paraquat-inducible protein A
VASVQVSEWPWVDSQSPDLNPMEHLWRHENSYAATLPIQPDIGWEDMQRMGETPQIKVCQACRVIPKRTRGCNHCQRCFNKVLSKGSEYLYKMWCFLFYF